MKIFVIILALMLFTLLITIAAYTTGKHVAQCKCPPPNTLIVNGDTIVFDNHSWQWNTDSLSVYIEYHPN